MKKKIKMLILGFVAILVLIGVLILLVVTAPETEEEEVEEEVTVTYAMIEENVDNFVSLTIENPTDTFEVWCVTSTAAYEEGETTTTLYEIQEVKEYVQDNVYTTSLVNSFITLSASTMVYETTDEIDLAEYGLETPQATLTLDVGDEVVLYLGDYNAGIGEYYAMIDGDDALYTITSTLGDKILCDIMYYMDDSILPTYDSSTSPMLVLHSMDIYRPDLEEPIMTETDTSLTDAEQEYMSSLIMTSPIETTMDYDFSDTYAPSVFGMTASEVTAIYDEADAELYGFDEPTATVHMTYTDVDEEYYDVTFVVGDMLEDGNYYLICGDKGLVYEVSTTYLSYVLSITADDLVTQLPLLPYIIDIDGVTMVLDGEEYYFELDNVDTEEEDDEGNVTVSTTTEGATCNGEELDIDEFKTFYQLMLSVASDSVNTDEPSGDPTLSITYHYSDGTTDELECYLISDDRRTQIVVNGVSLYEGRGGFIEKVRTEIVKLLNGEEVSTDW